MLVGAAVLPTAPLLIPGITAGLPDGVPKVVGAIDAARASLPPHELAVLVVPARDVPHGLYTFDRVDAAALGRPDLDAEVVVDRDATELISRTLQYSLHKGEAVPLGLVVLGFLLAGTPVVGLAVPQRADFDALVAVGTGVAEALAGAGPRAVAFVAGDLSAALDERSPRHRVVGASEWDQRVVATVDSGRLDGLRALGPDEAGRVHAIGWSSLAVLHGMCARAKLGMVVRHYSAPRGVGYLVATGA